MNHREYEMSSAPHAFRRLSMITFAQYDCLSAEEEKKTAVRAAAGDRAARDRLILANLRFVVLCTRPYRGHGLSDDELVEEGIIGLIEAVDHFDPERGARLMTCARFWIRNAILKALNKCGATIRLSDEKSRMLVKLRKALGTCGQISNAEKKLDTACALAGCTRAEARELLTLSQPCAEFDAPMDGADGASFGMQYADNTVKNVEDSCIDTIMQEHLLAAVKTLKPSERDVVIRHNGLFGAKPESFSSIGQRRGFTKARIFQIEQAAFGKLRKKIGSGC